MSKIELTEREESVLKKFALNKELASNRVSFNIGTYTKTEIAEMLEISRPTLDLRIKENTWRMAELKLIVRKLPY